MHARGYSRGSTLKRISTNRDNNANLLDRFNNDLRKIPTHFAENKMLFHQENARVHPCVVNMTKFNELCYESPPHQQHSLDIAPREYFLLSNLKKLLGRQRTFR